MRICLFYTSPCSLSLYEMEYKSAIPFATEQNSTANPKRLIRPHLQKILNILKFYSAVIVTRFFLFMLNKVLNT